MKSNVTNLDEIRQKTLTIPYWLNEKALAAKLNFSAVLQEALLAKLA